MLFFCKYILYIETPRPKTNRHVHAHKCLHCVGVEPATSCVVDKYSHHYAKSAVILQRAAICKGYPKQFPKNTKNHDHRHR
jgi:hypothetical protein